MRKAKYCAEYGARLRNDGVEALGPINLGGRAQTRISTSTATCGHLGNDDFLFVRLQYLNFAIDSLVKHTAAHFENRRTVRAMGSPTQKMWMTTPMTIPLKSNGRLVAAESGTTMRFMKK